MRIKKRNKNQYLLTPSGMWVRNFTYAHAPYIDVNKLIKKEDYNLILNNELKNNRLSLEHIDGRDFVHPNCVIVSDGYKFEEKQEILSRLPKNTTILGVNGSLRKWDLKHKRAMNYYVVNNPQSECLTYLPTSHSYYPRCIVSNRTYHDFILKYKGHKHRYVPTSQENYKSLKTESNYQIDDYRNPICGAISLAFRFSVRKLLLFCCDDAFKDERPGAERLENGLWMYPQHYLAHELMEANLYWLKRQEAKVKIGNHSAGPKYKEVDYISEEDIEKFFSEEDL
jgi:hypothetical protein